MKDINECEQGGEGPCGYNSNCTNTPGSFVCSCFRGYLMSSSGCQGEDLQNDTSCFLWNGVTEMHKDNVLGFLFCPVQIIEL